VSSAHDGARFHFSTGLVNSTNIDRLGVDSALVTISLKPHTAYRIGRSDSVGGLLVTLFRDSDPALTKDVSHVAEAPDQGDRPPVIQPVLTFTLNGMTAVENSPSEGPGKDVAQGEKHSTLKSTLLSEIRHLPESHLLPMALSFVSATLGTGLLLLLSRQRNTPRLRTAPAAVGAGFPEVLSTHIRDGSRGFERTEPRRHQAHRPSREDASALDIARKYGRGLGEINLSLALKAHQGVHVWAQKLEKIVDKGNDMHDRASVAKELRVGRGEVDLAMVFRHLTSSQTVREGPK
jgi:hypothetical protein